MKGWIHCLFSTFFSTCICLVAVYYFPHSHRPRDLLVTTQKPLGKKCRYLNSCESLLEVVGYCMELIAQFSFIQAQKSISDPVINAVTS